MACSGPQRCGGRCLRTVSTVGGPPAFNAGAPCAGRASQAAFERRLLAPYAPRIANPEGDSLARKLKHIIHRRSSQAPS